MAWPWMAPRQQMLIRPALLRGELGLGWPGLAPVCLATWLLIKLRLTWQWS
jgi:hypothetical protein